MVGGYEGHDSPLKTEKLITRYAQQGECVYISCSFESPYVRPYFVDTLCTFRKQSGDKRWIQLSL